MIEQQQDFQCANNHSLPIYMVIFDKTLKFNQRLLCNKCMDNYQSLHQMMSFKKVIQVIEDNQKEKLQNTTTIMQTNLAVIEDLKFNVQQIKSCVIQLLDQILNCINEWIANYQEIGNNSVKYSFFQELDQMIDNSQQPTVNQSVLDEINKLNQTRECKIRPKLELFNNFYEYAKCIKLLNNLIKQNNQGPTLHNKSNLNLENNLNNKEISQVGNIKLKLIDDSIGLQEDIKSRVIAFDNTNSKMISSVNNSFNIWNINKGKLILQQQVIGTAKSFVYSLIYSKKSQNFISGHYDGTIRCWGIDNQKEWYSQVSLEKHEHNVICLTLNTNEDQLISGSWDYSIKIWLVNFLQNQVVFLQTLQQHTNWVNSLCINNSDKLMVSCGKDNQILLWEKTKNSQWQFLQVIKQSIQEYGKKVQFLGEDQIIWIPNETDAIYFFDKRDGKFYENQVLTLLENKKDNDEYFFPIVYNQEKNILLVRHKVQIYLIRRQRDGLFQISASLNHNTNQIYGNITSNCELLVLWDNDQKRYKTYELIYQ